MGSAPSVSSSSKSLGDLSLPLVDVLAMDLWLYGFMVITGRRFVVAQLIPV